jgi:hypothetical protein
MSCTPGREKILLQTHTAVKTLDYRITFADDLFQALAVQDLYRASRVFYQSGIFKHGGGQAYAGAPRTEHLRHEFMGQGKVLGIHPILAHQEPPDEALFDLVQAIAGGELSYLESIHQGEAAKLRSQRGSGEHDVLKNL